MTPLLVCEATLRSFGYNPRNELNDWVRSPYHWTYGYDPIGNRKTSSGTMPVRTSTYNPSPLDNPLNQYERIETTGGSGTAQGYRFDEDGNLLEAYIAADMNCDGLINFNDIAPFVLALRGTPARR